MTKTILGQLDPEDLMRFRIVDCKIETAKLLPNMYHRDEIEQALMRWYQLREEFQKKYSLPEDSCWEIYLTNGVVVED